MLQVSQFSGGTQYTRVVSAAHALIGSKERIAARHRTSANIRFLVKIIKYRLSNL
jgi:hypothetical protein